MMWGIVGWIVMLVVFSLYKGGYLKIMEVGEELGRGVGRGEEWDFIMGERVEAEESCGECRDK